MDLMQYMLLKLRDWYNRMRQIMSFIRESFLPSDAAQDSATGFWGI